MTGFRSAQGSRIDWSPTDGTFSNFEFVDTRFGSHLPAQLWMVEASAPELFPASRRKFGEVLVAVAPQGPAGLPQVVGARLPGAVFFVQGVDFNPERTRLAGHTDLFSYTTP